MRPNHGFSKTVNSNRICENFTQEDWSSPGLLRQLLDGQRLAALSQNAEELEVNPYTDHGDFEMLYTLLLSEGYAIFEQQPEHTSNITLCIVSSGDSMENARSRRL